MDYSSILVPLGLDELQSGTFASDWVPVQATKSVAGTTSSTIMSSMSPGTNTVLGRVEVTSDSAYETVISTLEQTFLEWRKLPAPKRGDVVREIGDAIRAKKSELGALVSLESGKIRAEGEGEIQEIIDICDFAVGLSRQLYGLTMHSERPQHRMYEQWHPLGIVGVITAFNFPAAVWGWNAMLAAVCGNTVLWKPSELTPLTACALNALAAEVACRHGFPGLFGLITGTGPELGARLAHDKRIPLVSATGSCLMGRSVAQVVGARLGRTLLELGGNNAMIVLSDANPDLALRAVVFGAVGTAGQRCTTTRRLLIENGIVDSFTQTLIKAYAQVRIGDPMDRNTLMGPLISTRAVEQYKEAIGQILDQGGSILHGGSVLEGMPSPLYVQPTLVRATHDMPIVHEETFAPILYVIPIDGLQQAIEFNNAVPQGLSAALFTDSLQSAEYFLSARGADTGIANVNLGTSGAEIGGAFGGEKDTGGGRESGSDSWRAYMRRQTNTINWGRDLPLAQGITFL